METGGEKEEEGSISYPKFGLALGWVFQLAPFVGGQWSGGGS